MKKYIRSICRPAFSSILWLLIGVVFALLPAGSSGQQLTGTLSGTAYDQTGAVVPKASVVLKNDASGDQRTTVTGGDGHFVITAIQPGSYSIIISAPGFSSWQENDIVMSQGDNRDVPNIKLNVGGSSTEVNVIGGGDAIIPTDTGEISTTMNEQMINDFPLQGRDAGELLKIMPGMALVNGSSYSDKTVSTTNGPVGSFSSNGTNPNGPMAFMLDGANLVDPGNAGSQLANINADMVSSVKVLTGNYGAEYALGPTIFQAFSKSGGSQYHGELYLYTHNAVLNSVDAYQKSQGLTNAAESYYYMGGNVGGPIVLPFTKFNRDHKKLFFWGGYEYMKQQPAGSAYNFNIPNSCQLNGDFSNSTCPAPASAVSTWPNFYGNLTQNLPAGGTATSIPTSSFDPNIVGLLKNFYGANPGGGHYETPDAANGNNNYFYAVATPQNRWEATGKVDYAISDNDKVTGSYSYQRESDEAPIAIWWAAPWTLPYPTPAASTTNAYVVLTNYTHVFSPTTTNEFVFNYAHFVNPYKLTNPSAASRSTYAFNVQGLFGHTTAQIPNFEAPWGGELANLSNYTFTTGSFGASKNVPAFYDNFTKVIGNHTLKTGFFWDQINNTQNADDPDNGTYNLGGHYTTNNIVADLELGNNSNYQQQNYAPTNGLAYNQWSIYGQDSWKAAKSLTINIGLRLDHLGQWYGRTPKLGGAYPGFQVIDTSKIVNGPNAPNNTGLLWHATDPSVPQSGFTSALLRPAPRIGFAYDIFGNGKTVFRGGYATYFYPIPQNNAARAAGGPLNSFEFTTNGSGFSGYGTIDSGGPDYTPPSSVAQNGSSVDGDVLGSNRTSFTTNWNATISQALPWRSVLEVSYIGNRSANEIIDGGNSNLYNLNNVLPGRFFGSDPTTGVVYSPNAPPCSASANGAGQSLYCAANPNYSANFNTYHYAPYTAYQNMYLTIYAGYAKYNALQVQWQKQSGPVTFIANYTFSKVLGIRDGTSDVGSQSGGSGVDPFDIHGDYGPLAYDHTNIMNLTYNWALPTFIHNEDNLGMKLLGGAVNSWKISGYTSFQEGQPLQPNEGGNLNTGFAGGLTVPTVQYPDLPDNSVKLPNGLVSTSVTTSSWFGSNAYTTLIPVLTCNPLNGIHKVGTSDGKQKMRFNPACFATPAVGQQGPHVMPYIRLPNYWDSDLGIYKSFRIGESQSIQFRASATNWLNHPLGQFGLAGNGDISPNLQSTCYGCVDGQNIVSIAPSNTNTQTTGAPQFKTGSRFVTLALKYYF